MHMQPTVFLGPSLPLDEAREILDANYQPPLRAGDLERMNTGTSVGVIDGILDPHCRLPIEEARQALSRGVRVFGAASTGALLAVELEGEGVVGVGRVFAFLQDYVGDREDLIKIVYHDHDNISLTIPLIGAALALGDLSPKQTRTLIKDLSGLPLCKRTASAIESRMRSATEQERWNAVPIAAMFDVKADDARQLLRHLSNL
ncbi:hypothetical protein GCM10011335_45160 [Aureimonas glaciei]|uniref:TfuA-like core domain-containing protein n=2 Tax=Aureimonas glaciei TaxID=1776957 RepID=A0A916YAS1_9HYPH|nr:hypothetical protein GCM10011335_45160 [Aureimonas glaciei]